MRLPAVVRGGWPEARGERVALVGLLVLLIAGGLVRLGFMLAYRPAFVGYSDTISYMNGARVNVFGDPTRVVGYSMFLRWIHKVIEPMSGIIVIQHMFGIATGLILFAAVRRVGAPAWLGLIPAAIVLLNGDHMFLEHSPLTESLFILLLSIGLYCGVRASDDGSWRWALAAGAAFGATNTVRVVGLMLIIVLVAWMVFAVSPTWKARLVKTAATTVGVVVVLLPYAIAQHNATDYWGVTPRAGIWNLYARVAPFADCRRFTPPKGTARLCESTPPGKRTTLVEQYNFLPQVSPANQLFHANGSSTDPRVNNLLKQWTYEVIENQPLDYLATVYEGMLGYVTRQRILFENRDELGARYPEIFPVALTTPQVTAAALGGNVGPDYGEPDLLVRQTLFDRLVRYTSYTRVKGVLMAVLMALTFLALFLPRGRARRVGVFMFLVTWMALVTPPATHQWAPRETIATLGPLAVAAALGVWQAQRLVERWRGRSGAKHGFIA